MMGEESNDLQNLLVQHPAGVILCPQAPNAYTVPSSKQVQGFPEGF